MIAFFAFSCVPYAVCVTQISASSAAVGVTNTSAYFGGNERE
eukprot:IDg16270t1